MSKKNFWLSCLAAAALVGCSNDDDLTNNGGGEPDTEGCGYVSVNIVQPTSVTGRANGFEDGDAAENFAEEGLFFIFSADGNTMHSNRRIPLTATTGTGTAPAVEKIYKAVLVIDGDATKPMGENETKQIVCVLNAPAELENDISKLSDLEEKIDNYCDGYTTEGKFIMTNSVYMAAKPETDATLEKVLGTKITKDDVFTSAAQALKKPVDIYVERVVAKVKIKSVGETFDNQGTGDQTVDGVENQNYTIKVTGLSIANIANKAYLFKNISSFASDAAYTWAWDADNARSYWETVSLTEATDFENKSYKEIFGQWNTEATADTEETAFDIKNFTFTPAYILPNTTSNIDPATNNETATQKTAVLLTAQLMNGEGADAQPVDLVYLRGGYFTNDNALDVIAEYVKLQKYYKGKAKEGSTTGEMEYSSLLPGDFIWTNKYTPEGAAAEVRIPWIEDYEAVAKVNPEKIEGYDIYTKSAGGYTKVENGAAAIDAMLRGTEDAKSAYTAWVWTDGKCYYFVDIDQSSVAGATAHTYDGVVRNHIYELTLKSVRGLGVPVFDPDIDIIPQTPEKGDDLYYLAATVNVLPWKLVTQDVEFNN